MDRIKIYGLAACLILAACNRENMITRESHGPHPSGPESYVYSDRVLEYTPAPGQFINNPFMGFDGEDTPDAAVAYAQRRLAAMELVSLGGFGGYIVVGFDHSVQAWGMAGGYDFSITGNAFSGSSEPGVVWVAQDIDGDGTRGEGEPWYELKGSEHGSDAKGHAVTYYRPAEGSGDIPWEDNAGGSGIIESIRNPEYFPQETYFPLWLYGTASYTLEGTLLPSRLEPLPGGNYRAGDYGWGYADNYSLTDMRGGAHKNYFRISDAVDAQGNAAELKYIDFIKVQTGVAAVAGPIGELSTEVCRFTDENLRLTK